MSMKLSPTATLLRALIAIPSVNPADRPGTPHVGEKALAEWLAKWLKKRGAAVRLQPVLPGRPNLVARFQGRGKNRKRLLLAPHLDTVSVEGMSIDPFDPVVRNGRILGRGASDTKGPMAAMLTALESHIHESGGKSGWDIDFVATMGEETGCLGAHAHAKHSPDYDFAIIGEPTDLKMIHAHKGAVWLEIDVPGRARHASIATPADNAILSAAPLLDWLAHDLPPLLPRSPHPVLGLASVNPTILHAGTKANISPELCRIVIDIRTTPAWKLADFLKAASPLLKKIRARTRVIQESNPLDTNPNNPHIRRISPLTRGLAAAPWFCDAAVFGARGIPAVALGPGSIQQAHTKDEFIRLADLERGHRVYREVLRALTA